MTENDVVLTTDIPASECTAYLAFTSEGVNAEGLPPCGGGPITSDTYCQAQACTTYASDQCCDIVTVYATSYQPDEYAPVVVNGATIEQIPASQCYAQTSPVEGFSTEEESSAPVCGPDYFQGDGGDSGGGGGGGGDGSSTITYTYTTDGATIVVVTVVPSHGGPFNTLGSGSGVEGRHAYLVFWVWVAVAIVSGTGMLIL